MRITEREPMLKARLSTRSILCVLVLLVVAAAPSPGAVTAPAVLASPATPASLQTAVEQALDKWRNARPPADKVVSTVALSSGWAYGTAAIRASAAIEGHPEALLFIARQGTGGWAVALEGDLSFQRLLHNAPNSIVPPAIKAIIGEVATTGEGGIVPAGDGAAQLSLPWATGETQTFTSGPHDVNLSGLDFAGGSGMVRSAREGVAYRPCANKVLIYHADGWRTGYYHLTNIQVAQGQQVTRGQVLGQQSDEFGCGGDAFGAHLHFWLKSGDADVPIDGRDIGGWNVQYAGQEREGCLVRIRDNDRQCKPNGQIYNDGTVGSGTPPPPQCPQGAEGILVKDIDDANVERDNDPAGLNDATGNSITCSGHGSWTFSNSGSIENSVKWKPPLDRCGQFEVFVFVPWVDNGIADTSHAIYQIKYRGGTAEHIVDQNATNLGFGSTRTDRWVSLGSYLFSKDAHTAGESVFLGDTTGETGRAVLFDDVRWVFRGPDDAACNTPEPSVTPSPSPQPARATWYLPLTMTCYPECSAHPEEQQRESRSVFQ